MNRFTLIIDGNWLLQSRASVMMKGFSLSNTDIVKQSTQEDLSDLLAKSINVVLNRFPSIDNVVLVADGGSWRRRITVKDSVGEVKYKSNRDEERAESEFDWKYIFETLNKLCKTASDLGINVSREYEVEGDDWCWYWSRYLNAKGTNCMIWTSDCDLKQLVRIDPDTNAFTTWYNDKTGLVLPESLESEEECIDLVDFFMKPQLDNQILEALKSRVQKHTYINADEIVINKTICGDAGDMVMPAIRYRKGDLTYGIGNKDYEKLINDLGINDLAGFDRNLDGVVAWLLMQNKYKGLGLKKEDVKERLKTNRDLVWLDESSYPADILEKMTKSEYKQFDVGYIRSNYRCLVPDDGSGSDIERLFEDSIVGSDGDDLPF